MKMRFSTPYRRFVMVSLAVALAVSLSSLAACAKKTEAPKPTTPAPAAVAPKTTAPKPTTAPAVAPKPAAPKPTAPATAPKPTAAAPQKTVWKVATSSAQDTSQSEWMRYFAQQVDQLSKGRLEIKIYYSEELGHKGADYLRVLRDGLVDIGQVMSAAVSGTMPIIGLGNLPGLMSDPLEMLSVRDKYEPVYDEIFAKQWKSKLLFSLPSQAFILGTVDEMKGMASLKGYKVRAAGWGDSELLKRLGATPVTVAFAEVYPALQRGVAGGAITANSIFQIYKLYEVVKHLYLTPLSNMEVFSVVTLDAFNKQPKDVQQAVLDAAKRTEVFIEKELKELDGRYLPKLKQAGMLIHDSLPADIVKAAQEQSPAIWTEWATKSGPEAPKLLEAVRKALKR